ncbi:MAG: HNH endonuclease signature motif containing protein [Carboxydocellales bacterium]
MRPVDKGASPYDRINHYTDAQPYLENRIGIYCSYCELPLRHTPHVEHKESKNSGGALTDWKNLLFSCVYCNSRKLEKIKAGQANLCIWPDNDNTFMAYNYENGMPTLNDSYLSQLGQATYDKAKKLFDIVMLDNVPSNPKDKDRRWKNRVEAYSIAKDLLSDWIVMKETEYKDKTIKSIKNNAIYSGFFSVWMTVFKDEVEIKNKLIDVFIGAAKNCFDANGNPIRRNGGII